MTGERRDSVSFFFRAFTLVASGTGREQEHPRGRSHLVMDPTLSRSRVHCHACGHRGDTHFNPDDDDAPPPTCPSCSSEAVEILDHESSGYPLSLGMLIDHIVGRLVTPAARAGAQTEGPVPRAILDGLVEVKVREAGRSDRDDEPDAGEAFTVEGESACPVGIDLDRRAPDSLTRATQYALRSRSPGVSRRVSRRGGRGRAAMFARLPQSLSATVAGTRGDLSGVQGARRRVIVLSFLYVHVLRIHIHIHIDINSFIRSMGQHRGPHLVSQPAAHLLRRLQALHQARLCLAVVHLDPEVHVAIHGVL